MQQQFSHSPNDRRYDTATLQRVIEVATRLQEDRNETLDTVQVEQLGRELGIAPEFIRQALQLVETNVSVVNAPPIQVQAQQAQTVYVQPQRKKVVPLSKRGLQNALLPALCYVPILFFFAYTHSRPGLIGERSASLLNLLALIVPALVVAATAWTAKHRRLGLLAGAAFGACGLIAISVALMLRGGYWYDLSIAIPITMGLMFLGFTVTSLRKWWDKRPSTEEEALRVAGHR
jgi:hypothetical protein